MPGRGSSGSRAGCAPGVHRSQNTTLVVNALEMAISNRNPTPGTVFHSDHGVQFTSWTFTNRVKDAGLMPSLGTVGDGYDCETVFRCSSRCDPCYDWPCGCLGVDLSAGSSDTPRKVARRVGSDLIGA